MSRVSLTHKWIIKELSIDDVKVFEGSGSTFCDDIIAALAFSSKKCKYGEGVRLSKFT